jgi:DNA transformation protein and related proteins
VNPDFLRDLFADFGSVEVRRLFGGAGLFADGVMFGLVSGGQIYLKADTESVPRFEAEGCGPFEYGTKTGKRAIASFRRLPDRLYDDTGELAQWARAALAVARQSAAGKPSAKAPSKRKKSVKVRRPSTGRRR